MSRFRLFDLNDPQRNAVTTTEGPLLILAGAGTGKTRVITFRIAYLVAQNVDPARIMAVTFTNKAANEMRERVAKMIEESQAKKLTVSTFHALCVRILRQDIERLGYKKNFTIYDDGDQLGLIKKIITRVAAKDEKLDPNLARGLIGKLKNAGLSAAEDDRAPSSAISNRFRVEAALDAAAASRAAISDADHLLYLVKANQLASADTSKIKAPALILYSPTDLVFPPALVEETAKKIRDNGTTVETGQLAGPNGHLNGVLAISQAADRIEAFLAR